MMSCRMVQKNILYTTRLIDFTSTDSSIIDIKVRRKWGVEGIELEQRCGSRKVKFM